LSSKRVRYLYELKIVGQKTLLCVKNWKKIISPLEMSVLSKNVERKNMKKERWNLYLYQPNPKISEAEGKDKYQYEEPNSSCTIHFGNNHLN